MSYASANKFLKACEIGDVDSVMLLHRHDFHAKTLGIALYNACKGYHTDIITFLLSLLSKTVSYNVIDIYNDGLIAACEEGYIDLVKLMIENGADNFDDGLESVCCCCGNYDIAKLMIDKGATVTENHFVYACTQGHLELVKLLIEHGDGTFCYTYGLHLVCRNHHYELIKLMLTYGAKSLSKGLEYLYMKNSSIHMLEYFAHNSPQNYTVNETPEMEKIVRLLLDEGADNLRCLMLSNNLMFYRLHCIQDHKNPTEDEKYNKLLTKHPFYILLVGGNVRISKTGDNCGIKMLHADIFRQLFTYF